MLTFGCRGVLAAYTLASLAACGPSFAIPFNSASSEGAAATGVAVNSAKFTKYTLPTPNVDPFDIALGTKGDLYATQPILNQGAGSTTYLWQISETGHVTRIMPSTGATGPVGITAGANRTVF
ncbi:MAG TPA: hypothetical protein VGG70_08090, partial [Candidatus Cybelea sp.]